VVDPARAQKLMRERQMLVDALETHDGIAQELRTTRTDRAGRGRGRRRDRGRGRGGAEGAAPSVPREKEIEALLDGEADGNDTFLEINAGAGGTESCDWAAMLARMYVRWAEKEGLQGRADRRKRGRGGRHPLGRLPHQGAERLWLAEVGIRRAPAGAHLALRQRGARRHTSFSSVWVYPVVDDNIEIEINPPTSGSTPTARRAPAASTSTPPTRRCGSPISRPASW
jgi:peptide chain release factor 2